MARRTIGTVASAVITAGLAIGMTQPAVAAAGARQAGGPDINGCYWTVGANWSGGWCDGNGPASYRAWALCPNNVKIYGPWKWRGDRTSSYANCIGFTYVLDGRYELRK